MTAELVCSKCLESTRTCSINDHSIIIKPTDLELLGWVNEAAGTHMFESDPFKSPGLLASLCHWSQGWERLGRCPVDL